jgi:hypothetical protein
MNSTTVATVVAAGLAMASLAAGGIALWLHRRSKLQAPPAPQPTPTNPEPRRRPPIMRDETPSWFRDPFTADAPAESAPGASEADQARASEARPPPESSRAGPRHEPDADHQVELELGRQRPAPEVPTLEHRGSPAWTQVRTTPPAAAPTSLAVEPTKRKRRYPVRPGQPIEVVIGDAPPGTKWRPSRDDVQVQVIEQRGDRLRFTLHGPIGDVNVGLVQDGVKRPKAIRSWKFELCNAAA